MNAAPFSYPPAPAMPTDAQMANQNLVDAKIFLALRSVLRWPEHFMVRRPVLVSRWRRGSMEGTKGKNDECDCNNESKDAKRQKYAPLSCRLFFVVRHCSPQGK